ncbi:MAG: SsrA-binding protein SmpB [bacterium]
MSILAFNKRARYDYEISDTYEAGIVLAGHEVKSIKTGHVSLKGSFITSLNTINALPVFFLTGAHIPVYKSAAGKVGDYSPDRSRKILLHKKEIEQLIGKKQEQGLTLVPIKIYTKGSLIKLEFGVGRGKKKYDKRESIKKRDQDRQLRTLTKESRKVF